VGKKTQSQMVLPLAQLLKHVMSGLSEESHAELIFLERHEIPLSNLWVNQVLAVEL